MTQHPITIKPQTSLFEALGIMRREKVRRLPVLDDDDKLVGIVLERDLLYASPSPATTLSVYEMNYLISKIKIKDVMSREVVTVDEDTPLEEAARIMVDNSIGGLPVMRGDRLVGLITESDLFKTFLEQLGARAQGLRVTIRMPEVKGALARLTSDLAAHGADIVSLTTFWGEDLSDRAIVFKVQDISREQVEQIIGEVDAILVDIRET
jgi:acetoin utilization protein AcuB